MPEALAWQSVFESGTFKGEELRAALDTGPLFLSP